MSNRDYDELFIRGTNAQREELDNNDHKGEFGEINIRYAYSNIAVNAKTMAALLDLPKSCDRHVYLVNARAAAADIANFAHMIILKCDKELEIKTPTGG